VLDDSAMTGRGWRLVLARRATARVAIPASVDRFAKRARRRRLRAAWPWLTALLALALAGIGAGLVYGTSVFGAGTVRVEGATAPDDVRLFAAVPHGEPLARLDLAAVERRVARYPPVDKVTVRPEWPRTVVVRVWERAPVAAVPMVGSFALVDAAGVPFRQVTTRPAELPLVRLASPDRADGTTRAALQVLAALTSTLRAPLLVLVADAPTRIRLELVDGRTIVWGDATENEAKVRVATSMLESLDDAAARTLDVSSPSVVAVR
jgi:cell division protein FtsQ